MEHLKWLNRIFCAVWQSFRNYHFKSESSRCTLRISNLCSPHHPRTHPKLTVHFHSDSAVLPKNRIERRRWKRNEKHLQNKTSVDFIQRTYAIYLWKPGKTPLSLPFYHFSYCARCTRTREINHRAPENANKVQNKNTFIQRARIQIPENIKNMFCVQIRHAAAISTAY